MVTAAKAKNLNSGKDFSSAAGIFLRMPALIFPLFSPRIIQPIKQKNGTRWMPSDVALPLPNSNF